MRRLYLIRHGMPDFPDGKHMCIGTTDIPLGPLGRMQAVLLGEALRDKVSAVYTSPLSRAMETAEHLSLFPVVLPGLSEISTGIWEGLSFDQIKADWPELYIRRGIDITLQIPGSEDLWEAQERFTSSVNEALSSSSGDVAVVAHSTVIQLFLCYLSGISPQMYRTLSPLPYGSYTVINVSESCEYLYAGVIPSIPLSPALCLKLLDSVHITPDIRAHCIKVSEKVLEIYESLQGTGLALNRELIVNSALLHDVARLEKDHASTGALWLDKLGYCAEAEIIRSHHDLDFTEVDEAAIVYIADKCIKGTKEIGIESRFQSSLEKCTDEAALAAHNVRYKTSLAVRNSINSLCGRDIIL